MAEQRVTLRYSSDDPTPVTLAPFLEAEPSTIRPGDYLTVPQAAADVMLREENGEQVDPRWTTAPDGKVGDNRPGTVAELSEQLVARRESLGRDVDAPVPTKRVELVDALDALDLVAPPVPEQPEPAPALLDLARDAAPATAEGDNADTEGDAR